MPTNTLNDRTFEVDADVRLRTFVTPTCPYCPKAVITAFRFALANPRITAEGIEANEFPELSSRYHIHGVPDTIVNHGKERILGAQPLRVRVKLPEGQRVPQRQQELPD